MAQSNPFNIIALPRQGQKQNQLVAKSLGHLSFNAGALIVTCCKTICNSVKAILSLVQIAIEKFPKKTEHLSLPKRCSGVRILQLLSEQNLLDVQKSVATIKLKLTVV